MFMMLVPPSKAPHGALIGSSRSGWVWSAIAVGRNENGREIIYVGERGVDDDSIAQGLEEAVTVVSPPDSRTHGAAKG